ncbi:Uncharacterised protein [Mycobacterium tuberculosis]|nr:Uncharacterised protein [Mycobacterium tuberculosis]
MRNPEFFRQPNTHLSGSVINGLISRQNDIDILAF